MQSSGVKPIRFARSSRKHRIGRASARHVIATVRATEEIDSTGTTFWSWIGDDERGRELEILAIEKPDVLLIIHVMPTRYRRKP